MRKLIWLLTIIPIVNLGQKVGDSICFKTIYSSVYHGTIEKIDSDGYFFKNKKERVLYLKNSEINSFKTFPHPLNNSTENETRLKNLEKPEKNLLDINKLGPYVGEEIIIFLKDGRELKGKIIKISYKIDVFGDQHEVVKFLYSKNKMNILTSEIKKVQYVK